MEGNALQIVKQAASELGLPVPSELVTSHETTSIQLLALLNAAGNELISYFDWEFLTRTHDIVSEANVGAYPAPSDFGHMLTQTLWDKSNHRPAYGPASAQGWQVLTNAVVNTGPFVRYRVARGVTDFLPVPTVAGQNFNYQYISNGWVQSYVNPSIYTPLIANDLDTIKLDFWLVVKFLKLKMWQAKGLDTTSLVNDFARAFDACTGQDHGAPTLALTSSRQLSLLSNANIPDGNWNTV